MKDRESTEGSARIVILSERGQSFQNVFDEKVVALAKEGGKHQGLG